MGESLNGLLKYPNFDLSKPYAIPPGIFSGFFSIIASVIFLVFFFF